MQLFYRFYYFPPINWLVRNLFRLLNKAFGTKLRSSVSGRVNLTINERINISLNTNESGHVAHALFYEGAEKYEFTQVFIPLIQKCECFFDVGANIGYFSILANAVKPGIKIHSFEPGKGPSYFLEKNLKENNCSNAVFSKTALTNFKGEIEFHEIQNNKFPYLQHFLSGASSTVNKYDHLPGATYKVQCTTLDQYCNENLIEQIDLIKLDTEFNEHLVLEQSKQTLKKFEPIIICEVYPVIENQVYEHLMEIDYQIYHYTNGRLKKIQHFNELPEAADRNFFFVTKSKLSLLKEFID